jgi:transposase-like protein
MSWRDQIGEKRWTPTDAARVIEALDRSGLCIAAFAKEHGLCAERLRRWRMRLHAPESSVAPSPSGQIIELVPVAAPALPPVGRVVIRCPSGHVIDLVDVDMERGLAAVLRSLRAVTC